MALFFLMIESFLYIVIGLVLLTFGGEYLVRAASRTAISFGISPLVVGLTIVAAGTSAPEFGVSLFATIQGNPEIAISNVVGSNIFNICFILGLCALVSPLTVHLKLIRIDVPLMIIVSAALFIFCFNGILSQIEGLTLAATAIVYLVWIVRASRKESQENKERIELAKSKTERVSLIWNSIIIFVSLGVLVAGSRFLVLGAVDVAKSLGVSDSLIGLTIVAAGTSLPEVATSLMATLRGQTDIAVGNVIGSNIMNILLILGLSAGIGSDLSVQASILSFDLIVMLFVAMISYPLLVTAKKLVRWEGALLFVTYGAYISFLINRG